MSLTAHKNETSSLELATAQTPWHDNLLPMSKRMSQHGEGHFWQHFGDEDDGFSPQTC